MDTARIAELLAPFLADRSAVEQRPTQRNAIDPRSKTTCHSEPAPSGGEEPAVLSVSQLEHISTYIDILLRWNSRINLTAIRDPDEIVTRHFGESLFAARHLLPSGGVGTAAPGCPSERSSAAKRLAAGEEHNREGHDFSRADSRLNHTGALAPGAKDQPSEINDRITLADLGSGAGFPGIPIKLWAPHISLTLIESNHKKATFLKEVTRALTLTNVNILPVRAESLPPHQFDVVTLRAVERFEAILAVAARLTAPGGRLALLISASQLLTAQSLLPALSGAPPIPIPGSVSRRLAISNRLNGQSSSK